MIAAAGHSLDDKSGFLIHLDEGSLAINFFDSRTRKHIGYSSGQSRNSPEPSNRTAVVNTDQKSLKDKPVKDIIFSSRGNMTRAKSSDVDELIKAMENGIPDSETARQYVDHVFKPYNIINSDAHTASPGSPQQLSAGAIERVAESIRDQLGMDSEA